MWTSLYKHAFTTCVCREKNKKFIYIKYFGVLLLWYSRTWRFLQQHVKKKILDLLKVLERLHVPGVDRGVALSVAIRHFHVVVAGEAKVTYRNKIKWEKRLGLAIEEFISSSWAPKRDTLFLKQYEGVGQSEKQWRTGDVLFLITGTFKLKQSCPVHCD